MNSVLERADLATLWLLGNPVSHSLSPLIQNRALQQLGSKAVYLAARVEEENFESVVRALPKLGAVGANVTVPHKERAFRVCDRVSDRAQAMGAVNTLLFRGQEIYGDNTDGAGWWRSLGQRCFERAVVIGAGGAARAVCYTLLTQGVSRLALLNRTLSRAEALRSELSSATPDGGRIEVFSLDRFPELLQSNTLVVQTTSVGLEGDLSPVPLPESLPTGVLLSELIYARTTALMACFQELGGEVQDGLGMLCAQGAESLALWLGLEFEEIPLQMMLEVARERVLGARDV